MHTGITPEKTGATTAVFGEPNLVGSQVAAPLLSTTTDVPQGWPTSPATIKISLWTRVWSLVVDVVLFGLSVAFLAFALIVDSYDGASTDENPVATQRLVDVSKYGPTIFPILFAAVVGRAAQSILTWRLEKGERIGVLDTLAGSTSLTSTVTTQVRLRAISILGLLLAAIWSLSPVGGQASFRQLSLRTDTVSHTTWFDYMVPNGNLVGFTGLERSTLWALVNTLFNAAIIGGSATKQSPRDLWGNLKIPRIEVFENSGDHDEDGWFNIDLVKNTDSDIYASLIGIPMSGLDSQEFFNYKTTLQTSYLNLSCNIPDYTGRIVPIGAWNVSNAPGEVDARIWWMDTKVDKETKSSRSNDISLNGSLEAFGFGYDESRSGYPIGANCYIRTVYVEVDVMCPSALDCRVSKLRRSRLPHLSTNLTLLDVSPGGYSNWWTFASAFIKSVTSVSYSPTLIDYYIAEPTNPAMPEVASYRWPAEIYAVRLGQLMNAYWACTSSPYAISAGITNTTSYSDPNISFAIVDPYSTFGMNYSLLLDLGPRARTWRTEGSRYTNVQTIVAHKNWVAASSIASAVLIIAALVPPVVRYFMTNGPEIMMNLSSLATRNNPYVPLPLSGTFLGAADRARLLKNYRVQLVDIYGESEVGNLVIGTVTEEGDRKRAKSRRARFYE